MKICTKCKVEKPKTEFNKQSEKYDGLQPHCRACKVEYRASKRAEISAKKASYAANNKEKISEYQSAYRAKNKEATAAYNSDYRLKNKAEIASAKAEYYALNRDKMIEYQARYRISNPEKVAARKAKYGKANTDKISALSRNRRARQRNAEGCHNESDIRSIFTLQRGLCANCKTKLFKSGPKKYHADHIMPLKLGGSNWPSNLQCLCPTCNLKKNAKDPAKWANENGRLL